MSKKSDPGRRSVVVALLAVIATLGAVLAFSLGSLAQADTTASPGPDPVTKAVINPGTTCPNFTNSTPAAAPCATTTNGQAPGTTLAGAAEGTVVSIHVDAYDAGPTGKLNSVVARLCRSGLSISATAQMSPSQSGNCIASPFVSGQDFATVSADTDNGNNTDADFVFKVGTGTETNHQGPGTAITCDANNPCSIWLDEQVDSTVSSSNHVFKHYDVTYTAVTPSAPGVTVHTSDVTVTVDLTPPSPTPGNPQFDTYHVSISPADAAAQAGPSTQTHYVFTPVKDFTTYTVSATASSSGTNGSTSAAGTGTGTPRPPAPTNVTATAGDSSADVSWTAPATISGSPTPSTYEVHATPCVTGTTTAPCPTGTAPGTAIVETTTTNATTWHFTGLTNGTAYFFTVAANYTAPVAGQGDFSSPSSVVAPVSAKLTQTLTVTRPQGALVMTQVCTAYPARSSAATGGSTLFAGQAAGAPQYTGSAVPNGGTNAGPQPDPEFQNYPYPTDQFGNPAANYPTNCNIDLGVAKLITSGPHSGQFFEATGVMDTVTVVETNSTDPGFNVSGQIPSFNDTSGHSFSGSELGLTPKVSSESQGFTESDGSGYQMNVLPRNTASCPSLQGASPTACTGQAVPPNSPNASGLSNLTLLASASSGQSLGMATLDGALDLFIPINKAAGTYTGVLSITAL